MWAASIAVGSIILTFLWYLERTTDVAVKAWATQILPVMVVAELFLWWGFRKAPNFIAARYTMSAMMHVLGWTLALCLLHEGASVKSVVGSALIIAGAVLVGK
ncbi:MAG TPA: hypothetical protein VM487_24100 [Phycisphaerae bacterium]|nr:hypothetical protein [Phycisphaerae bacterium]